MVQQHFKEQQVKQLIQLGARSRMCNPGGGMRSSSRSSMWYSNTSRNSRWHLCWQHHQQQQQQVASMLAAPPAAAAAAGRHILQGLDVSFTSNCTDVQSAAVP